MADADPFGAVTDDQTRQRLQRVGTALADAGWPPTASTRVDHAYLLGADPQPDGSDAPSALGLVFPDDDALVEDRHVKHLVRWAMERDASVSFVVTWGAYADGARDPARRRGVSLLEPADLDGLDDPMALDAGRQADGSTGDRAAPAATDASGDEFGPGAGIDDPGPSGASPGAADDDGSTATPQPASDQRTSQGAEAPDTALAYPFNEAGWWKTIGLGTVIEYLSVLVVPAILLQGYYVRVMRRTFAGDPEPPGFGNPGRLLVDGLKVSVIGAAYYAVPTLLFLGYALGSLDLLATGDVAGAVRGLVLGLVVSLLVAAVISYVAGAGVANFARTGRIRAAFRPRLLTLVFSGRWFVMYLKLVAVAALVGFLATVLGTLLSVIPVVGWLLAAVLVPAKAKYLGTVTTRLVARTFRDLPSVGEADPPA